jgi:putative colanic acid biosynthesis UDP-glucose lipid carrier transferase
MMHAPSNRFEPACPVGDRNERAPSPVAWSRRVAIDLVAFADVGAILLGGLLPAWLSRLMGGPAIQWIATLQGCLVTALFAYLCMRHFGHYDTRHMRDLPFSIVRILTAVLIAFVAALGLGLPFGFRQSGFWLWYATWAATSVSLIIMTRLVARRILSTIAARGHFNMRVAVYGSGAAADRITSELAKPELGIHFCGIFDDRMRNKTLPSAPGSIGSLDDLIARGRAGDIDRIIIALPPTADHRIADVTRRLEQLPVSLHVVTHVATDYVDAAGSHAVSSLGPIGLIDIKPKPLSDWAPHLKQLEDYILGTIALIIAAPVMAIVALAVKLDSPGPVLFRQRRHGLNRRVIDVLKFRTMRVQEDDDSVQQVTPGDERVTRIGRFLRSSSLDELPQLVNVLKGEMSLVGPRPHALVHDDHYGEMLERYANRHQVKPGMTGLAQVNGFRGPTNTPDKMQSRVEKDLIYIDTWSLWLDLRILALTVIRGFKHRNAL